VNHAISASESAYAWILRWYPPELRAEYGEEMAGVFSESLEDAWRRGSWRGVARAWMAVARDFGGIALPYWLARAAPVTLAIVASAIFYGSVLLAIAPVRHCHK
jgi:hypothetical protein